ncbi:MAG TPA: SDR family NAD(P)-dependent oxidoreductase [Verrucomicrobiae bacterium]|nr:SDR family NAD(P)-dependent oxidoreductase [Verrucomicrobiae bacterium]
MLQHQVVVVTGARGALGRAVRARFAEAGAVVAGIDREADIPANVIAADLGDAVSAERAIQQLADQHGRIDALLNLAGGFTMAPAGELAPWDALWKMNLATALHTCRAVIPGMVARGHGAIVNIGARVQPAGAQMAAYAASKSAVMRLTESLAEEVKASGVRVNCVMPSILDTEANRRSMPDADFGKWVAPAALADVLAFLCSDHARAVTGALIPVYGRM